MTAPYPITERRSFDPAEKARFYLRRTRAQGDMLKPDAHHVLVYRVDGSYVLDSDRMRASDERVINATHVSMVDTRRDAPVVVQFEIPSSDAADFEVCVTFVCSVTDPVAVVRGGVDAQEALHSYLHAHPRIFDLGLDYRLSEVNELRRAVSAQVTAYSTIKPPSVPGMTVRMASVTVRNPDAVAEYAEQHRGNDFKSRLARQDQENDHVLRAGQLLNDHSIESVQQDHDHLKADRDREHGNAAAAAGARHRREQATAQAEFELDQFSQRLDAIGTDPRRALMAAFAGGHIDAATLAERLRELDQVDLQAAQRELQLDREQRRELAEAQRAEDREVRTANREDERESRAAARDDERWRREEKRRRKDRRYDDDLRREQQIREDERERFRAKVELIRQASRDGHLDMVNLHVEQLFGQIVGDRPAPLQAEAKPEIGAADSTDVLADDAATRVNEDDD